LPFEGLTVSVETCDEPPCITGPVAGASPSPNDATTTPATVEGTAYYANRLGPGFWNLRVADAGGRTITIPVGEGSLDGHRTLNVSMGRLLYYFIFEPLPPN
jgi:hypothetical protein